MDKVCIRWGSLIVVITLLIVVVWPFFLVAFTEISYNGFNIVNIPKYFSLIMIVIVAMLFLQRFWLKPVCQCGSKKTVQIFHTEDPGYAEYTCQKCSRISRM